MAPTPTLILALIVVPLGGTPALAVEEVLLTVAEALPTVVEPGHVPGAEVEEEEEAVTEGAVTEEVVTATEVAAIAVRAAVAGKALTAPVVRGLVPTTGAADAARKALETREVLRAEGMATEAALEEEVKAGTEEETKVGAELQDKTTVPMDITTLGATAGITITPGTTGIESGLFLSNETVHVGRGIGC